MNLFPLKDTLLLAAGFFIVPKTPWCEIQIET